jgi:hypothetical protein
MVDVSFDKKGGYDEASWRGDAWAYRPIEFGRLSSSSVVSG